MIEVTQEVFRDYASYVSRVEAYRKEQWSCKYSGKGGLTYEDALEEEQKALAALAKVRGGEGREGREVVREGISTAGSGKDTYAGSSGKGACLLLLS